MNGEHIQRVPFNAQTMLDQIDDMLQYIQYDVIAV